VTREKVLKFTPKHNEENTQSAQKYGRIIKLIAFNSKVLLFQ